MLNVKERLPDGAAFKFLFHFPEVIRVKWRPEDRQPGSWRDFEYRLHVRRLGGKTDEIA